MIFLILSTFTIDIMYHRSLTLYTLHLNDTFGEILGYILHNNWFKLIQQSNPLPTRLAAWYK